MPKPYPKTPSSLDKMGRIMRTYAGLEPVDLESMPGDLGRAFKDVVTGILPIDENADFAPESLLPIGKVAGAVWRGPFGKRNMLNTMMDLVKKSDIKSNAHAAWEMFKSKYPSLAKSFGEGYEPAAGNEPISEYFTKFPQLALMLKRRKSKVDAEDTAHRAYTSFEKLFEPRDTKRLDLNKPLTEEDWKNYGQTAFFKEWQDWRNAFKDNPEVTAHIDSVIRGRLNNLTRQFRPKTEFEEEFYKDNPISLRTYLPDIPSDSILDFLKSKGFTSVQSKYPQTGQLESLINIMPRSFEENLQRKGVRGLTPPVQWWE